MPEIYCYVCVNGVVHFEDPNPEVGMPNPYTNYDLPCRNCKCLDFPEFYRLMDESDKLAEAAIATLPKRFGPPR